MLGLYIHVPFCSSRCGYCDFNTYTPQELGFSAGGTAAPEKNPHRTRAYGSTPAGYLDALEAELELAAQAWHRPSTNPQVRTVFFGGGTPSLLGAAGLTRALDAARRTIGIHPDAEITTEANPESTSPEFFAQLRAAGFTRISLGMQSTAPHVLQVLNRRHTPGRPIAAAREAHAAGFRHINLDVIYGTPTETESDLRATLDAVLEAGVDHVSAYSLIVEDGTALARKVRSGALPAPDDDVLADRYALIDSTLASAGFSWYEVSNWAKPGGECQHNLLYWRGGQWWGAGPGAHGCVRLGAGFPHGSSGLTRTINAKHPGTYWQHLCEGAAKLPIIDYEPLSEHDVRVEQIMLGLRLKSGLPRAVLRGAEDEVQKQIDANLLEPTPDGNGIRISEKGRYLADGVVTDLILALE